MFFFKFADDFRRYTRRPLSIQSSELLLVPLLCYYVTAILVTLPRTLLIRLIILPITLFYAFRASTQLDLAAGYGNGRLSYLNQDLVVRQYFLRLISWHSLTGRQLAMTFLAIRAIMWTFQQIPYQHIYRSRNVSPTYSQILLDAADLSFNARGIGWSHLPSTPTESRPPLTFFLHTLVSLLFHVVLLDVTHRFVQLFGPDTISSPVGGSIFDPSLPPFHRYICSTLITLIAGLMIYAAIQTLYQSFVLFSLVFLRHSPSQWPPLFDHPWFATSLSQFWSRRWHQLFKDIFVSFGGNTLALLMGRVGRVLGAFFVSGAFHALGLWGMGRGGEFLKVIGFFMIMAVGILFEYSWKKITGSRVDGFFGRVWTMVWLLGWGNILVDAWCTKGMVGSVFFPDGFRPSDYILSKWIKS